MIGQGAIMAQRSINIAGLTVQGWYDFSRADTLYDAVSGGSLVSAGGTIARIEDLSGNGRHLTQATAGLRPTRQTAIQNGLDVGRFSGNRLTGATAADWKFMHDGTNVIVCCILRAGNVADPNALFVLLGTNAQSTTTVGYSLSYDDRASVPRNNVLNNIVSRGVGGQGTIGNISANDVILPNTFQPLSVLTQPTNGTASARSSIVIDGVAIANNTNTFGVSAANPLGAFTIGAAPDGTSPLNGDVGTVVIVSGSGATEYNRIKIMQRLRRQWAV